MQTYLVQIRLDRRNFRDVYVQARDDTGAVLAARKRATRQELRWAAFVL
jgi:hypothetical protein